MNSALHPTWLKSVRTAAAALLLAVAAVPIFVEFAAGRNSGGAGGTSSASEVYEVVPELGDVHLVCGPGIFGDEASPELDAESATAGASADLLGGGTTLQSSSAGDIQPVSAAALGDPAALQVHACGPPANVLATVGGSTATGEDTLLILSNPSSKPVSVSVWGFARGGSLGAAPAIAVPATSTVVWRPAVWFPDEEILGLLLEADGLGISGFLQTSGHRGEVSTGTAFLPAMSPASELLLPGVDPEVGEVTLQLLNPDSDPTRVSVQVISPGGASSLPGGDDLLVEPGVTTLSLNSLGDDPVALRIKVSGDGQVAASVLSLWDGTEDPEVDGELRGVRQLIGAAEKTGRIPQLPVEELRELLESSGLEEVTFSLTTISGEKTENFTLADSSEGEVAAEEAAPFDWAVWTVRALAPGGSVSAVVPAAPDPTEEAAKRVTLQP